jgi:hypothetical protein
MASRNDQRSGIGSLVESVCNYYYDIEMKNRHVAVVKTVT